LIVQCKIGQDVRGKLSRKGKISSQNCSTDTTYNVPTLQCRFCYALANPGAGTGLPILYVKEKRECAKAHSRKEKYV